jgi:hypothetical protein
MLMLIRLKYYYKYWYFIKSCLNWVLKIRLTVIEKICRSILQAIDCLGWNNELKFVLNVLKINYGIFYNDFQLYWEFKYYFENKAMKFWFSPLLNSFNTLILNRNKLKHSDWSFFKNYYVMELEFIF